MQVEVEHLFPFKLDDFQLEAIRHLEAGKSVVVCSPTGSGKTVVAEYAVEMALMSNQRCYYTTPLKALSNQKLYDLRQKYGESKVGLLTGDLSINRDAPIVVMTTEVFRNMLYGTILGDVAKNLKNVASVVLDECHYMNDTERGTVWEESIIYAPKDIQLVALSATVANADELTAWIDEIHGPTELVVSDFRPVPLRFHYFGERRLYPLINPGGGVNTFLKSRFGKKQRFQHNKDKDRKRRPMGGLYTHPADVLANLSARNMLPAIYFLFSRRGCEEAMKMARGIPLLQQEEQRELKRQVEQFTKDNPNLANHPHLPYLMEGMSVHHAGMLPSWKGMVEKLFVRGLLKVVFATETLAAGINMPARSTVISCIQKRGDEGHRELRASEFLQMSGRAGRRGMDELGHVVVLHNPFESVEDAAKLAQAPADPLSSRFTPSYGMVLNLLERHTIDDARDLIERSFGQFIINKQLGPTFEQRMALELELEKLQAPLCPGEIGDLNLYAKRLEAIRAKHKQLKTTEKALKQHTPKGGGLHPGLAALEGTRSEIQVTLQEAYAMPCHGCPVQKPCSKQTERIGQITKRIKEIDKRVFKETNYYWRTFEALGNILRSLGYLDGNKPTKLGNMAAAIRGQNELYLTEMAMSGIFDQLNGPELAALLTALVGDEARGGQDAMRVRVSPQVEYGLAEAHKIQRKILRLQKDFDVDMPIELGAHQSGLTEMWAQGASWHAIRNATPYDEGDVVRSLRRTLDLCRQYIRAAGSPESVVDKCRTVEMLLNRDEVSEDF